jgi:hypothetical protein
MGACRIEETRVTRRLQLTFAVSAFMLLVAPAAAQQVESAYTDVNLDECSVVSSDDFGSTWACAGYKGIPVMIAEGDLRFFVSYGLRSTEEKAAAQTPPPFNRLGPKIEWRLSNAEGGWKPFATILRFYVADAEDSSKEGQILVVTKLEPGATCHVAYIDALANEGANELARDAADDLAPEFDCESDPEIVGDFEAWDR